MKLHIINSGSVGNCYILDNGISALIIECGVNFKDVKVALDFQLSKVVGCIISHEHLDHCKSVKDVAAAGINIYCSKGTADAMHVNSHRIHKIEKFNQYKIGEFTVMPFDVKHDCAEPFGFLINHKDCGNVLFITDSYYCEYTFRNLNNVIVEANYDKAIVNQRLRENKIHGKVRDRVVESHMSIDTCIELLKSNDLTKVNNIVLIHLSDGNSNAADFKSRVTTLTGKSVHIAAKNTTINFSVTPF